jgi:hypothetical protein
MAAAEVMVDYNPVPNLHVAHARAYLCYLAAGLMPAGFELRWVSTFFAGCSVGPEVAAADSGRTHFNDYLRETRFGLGELPQFQLSLAEEYDSSHPDSLHPVSQYSVEGYACSIAIMFLAPIF